MNNECFDSDVYSQLNHLVDSGKAGVIDGVHFDLRHPSIPHELWHCPVAAYCIMINFPSNRSAGTSQSVLSPDIDDQFEQAEVGDTVSIAELARFDRGNGPLSDTHDTVEWWATLELIRQTTGERIALSGRVHFVPRDALGPHSPHLLHDDEDFADYVAQHAISFGKIRLRISRLASAIKRRIPAKWARVDGVRCRVTDEVIPLLPPNTEIEFGWTYEAPFGPAREWLEMADLAQSYAIEEEEAFGEKVGSESLTALLDLVAAASYSLARAECELRVAPLAMRGIKVAQGGSKGGTATWD